MTSSFQKLQDLVWAAEAKCGRPEGSVKILPVSKGQSVSTIQKALSTPSFPKILGENYLSELEQKCEIIKGVEWHFIGALQSRKIPAIAKLVTVIQTVSRPKEIEILSQLNQKPQFYIQVNVSGESQKNGVPSEGIEKLLELVQASGLSTRLVGLMCVPENISNQNPNELRLQFSQLRKLRDRYLPQGKLSMGMSADFEIAIHEGSDLIRVGTALFGERPKG